MNVTDTQTDTRPRLCIASSGKSVPSFIQNSTKLIC